MRAVYRWGNLGEQLRYHTKKVKNGCWLWSGSLGKGGYAWMRPTGTRKMEVVHRVAYKWYVGEIPKGMELDHLCRTRHCINPKHLEPVSPALNRQRAIYPKETHRNGKKTHCIYGHRFSKENTAIVKWNGTSARRCRICARKRFMKWYRRNKK